MVTKEQIARWMQLYAARVAAAKDLLTELDAAIGDADHGINMDRGFGEVLLRLPELARQDMSALLKGIGMTLLSKVGGASGPLYGTLFLRMAQGAGGHDALTVDEFVAGLEAGIAGIQQRGSARPGEKTMVDALLPAMDSLRSGLAAGASLAGALTAAAEAAEAGMEATVAMQAAKGRASYLGPRSIGHQDPGATSAWMLVQAAAETLTEE
ncbi:MAG: dihydroxyacetone kinase subunit L [Caldilineaceae bacterium]|nr:dihydroxyacetone kinase subunit L [Caldilineaceae bacterium]